MFVVLWVISKENQVYFIWKTNFSFVWQRFFRLINRMHPPTVTIAQASGKHRRLNNRTYVYVYFSKFSVPFFLASSRWFSLSVDNLFTCIIFVYPIFIRPLAFSLKLVSWAQCHRLANAFWPSKPLYCNAPITLTLYYLMYVCQRVLNCFHLKPPSCE